MRVLSLLFIFVLMLNSGCDHKKIQDAVHEPFTVSPLQVQWEVKSNIEDEEGFHAALYLYNGGTETFSGEDWILYFNSIRFIEPNSVPKYLNLSHINGDFFKLKPTSEFPAIEPGDKLEIPYRGQHFSIKKSDAPDGFYFVFEDGRIETVASTEVLPFFRDEQTMRSLSDMLEVPTAESDFIENEYLSLLGRDEIGKVTPTPVFIEPGEGFFDFSGPLDIYHDPLFISEASYLSDYLFYGMGIANKTVLPPVKDNADQMQIVLELSPIQLEGDEAYRLDVMPDRILITAHHSTGIFYGVQSLISLIENRDSQGLLIPGVHIQDYPAFRYRGMHLDVSRNFQSAEDVKLLLDVMAQYKLNKFHFHLTDDEGWRIAIDPLPELVKIGGLRGHTTDESDRLIPAYGSGPDANPGRSFGSGWYSRAQYIDLLTYANERHIEVIPEIDVPGHARAAIIAMRARAERLESIGQPEEADRYRLDEEADQSEYLSIQNFNDNVINVCIESTYRFMELIFDELIAMHREAGAPLSTIHVGGDEVPHGVWEKSPSCQSLMDREGIENVRELQSYFFNRLNQKLVERGLKMAGWEEVVFFEDPEDGSHIPNPQFTDNVIPHVWSNIWGSGTEHYTYELANLGYQVIMSHASSFYFDMAHNKDWREPGFYWAAMFDTIEPFSFIPSDLYRNAVTDNYGRAISPDMYDDAVILLPHGRENILGIQGQLWTETVNREGRMHYLIFPRLLGLAERAWVGDPDWSEIENRSDMFEARNEAWNEFANRLGQLELSRFDRNYREIGYRIPTPGAVLRSGYLNANVSFPGLEIRFTTDGSKPDSLSQLYTEPVDVSGAESIKIAVFNSIGRSGRMITLRSH